MRLERAARGRWWQFIFPLPRMTSSRHSIRVSVSPKSIDPPPPMERRAGFSISPITSSAIPTLLCKSSRMTDQEILSKFTRILRDLLFDDSIELTMETRREDVSNWDSFNYINFIVAVEIEFGVKFKVADIESFANVGAIVKETTKMLAKSLSQ